MERLNPDVVLEKDLLWAEVGNDDAVTIAVLAANSTLITDIGH